LKISLALSKGEGLNFLRGENCSRAFLPLNTLKVIFEPKSKQSKNEVLFLPPS
jgi:hypothetical protein